MAQESGMNDKRSATQPQPAPHPPVVPGEVGEPRTSGDPMDAYHTAAETVGFMPSLRGKDNLIQLAAVVLATLIGAAVGIALTFGPLDAPWYGGALIGGIAGLVVGAIVSGIALMVLGWVRAAKKVGGRREG